MIKRILKAILSGILIGLAGVGFTITKNAGFIIISSLVFPIGLFLICTYKYDLYTGKIGYAIKNDEYNILDYLLMLIFNLLGALFVGVLFRLTIKDNEVLLNTIDNIAKTKFLELSFLNILLVLAKSTLCGVLVYIAVDLYKKSETLGAKVISVWIPIFFFVLLGLDHSIANMFYLGQAFSFTFSSFIFLIIAIIGNSVGAIIFNQIEKYLNNNSERKEK